MARSGPLSAAPAPRPQRRDAHANRARILRAARDLIAERGPEGLTVSAVAHRAGINRTTAYQHFRTRDELVAAAMADLAGELSALFVDKRPLDEQIDRISEFCLDHPEIARLWMYQLLSETLSPGDRGWGLYQSQLGELVSGPQAKPGIDPEMLGRILVSASLVWSLLARMTTPDEASAREANKRFTRELKRLLLYGVLEPDHWPELVENVK